MDRRPPRSTQSRSSAASDVYKRQEVHLPAEQWQHDWEQALDRYLQAPATSVVSLGLATIKFQLMAPGSMFLVAEALPAEVHAQYPDAKGVHRSTCLLHLFAHPDISRREALWSMGLQALGFYEKPTDAWHAQKEELLQSAGDGAQLGVEMAQHLLSHRLIAQDYFCLLYTSDAADDLLCVDLGGSRINKKKNKKNKNNKH